MPAVSDAKIKAVFAKVDRALRENDRELATRLADQLVYSGSGVDDPTSYSNTLVAGLAAVRERRRPGRRAREIVRPEPPTR